MKTLKNLAPIALAVACTHTSRGGASAPALYVYESDGNGFNTKTVFLDTGREVVAFDAQFTPALARQSLEFLKSKTSNPVTKLVITHPNPDKFNGASVFREIGAEIIASEATARSIEGVHAYKKNFFVNVAKMFTNENYPQPVGVDRRFEKELVLELGNGEQVVLTETGIAGVSSNQTIAYIPGAKAAIVGDLVHHKAHAWLEGGIVNGQPTPTLDGWVRNLELLEKTLPVDTIIYGGRGEAVEARVALPSQKRYLAEANELVTSAVAELNAASSDFYAQLTKRFEAKFPEYRLGYMIQYGAYGLVGTKSSR